MGLYEKRPLDDTKVVDLFSRAAKPPETPFLPFLPMLKLAAALQNAFVTYNLTLMKVAADYTKEIIDTASPPLASPKHLIADKEWLSEQARYQPFLKDLETEGYHEYAAYNSALEMDGGDAVLPAKFVYWMNVMQGGNRIQIFHGDSDARAGSLLDMAWADQAKAFAINFYDVVNKATVAVKRDTIPDKVCGLLSDLVGAINRQNRQIYHHQHPPESLHRRQSAHLHLVS